MKHRKFVLIANIFLVLIFIFTASFVYAVEQSTALPDPPTALKLSRVKDGFKLQWNLSKSDPKTVTGYEIQRANMASGPFKKIVFVQKGTSSYIDKKMRAETVSYYKVRAKAGDVFSDFSNTVTGEYVR